MNPSTGRMAFQIAFFLFFLSLVTLPFQEWNSPSFVINVLALIVSAVFLLFVVWEVRRQATFTLGSVLQP